MPMEMRPTPNRGLEPPLLEVLRQAVGNDQATNKWLTGNDPYLASRAGMGRFALANPMQDQQTPDFQWQDNDPAATNRAVESVLAQADARNADMPESNFGPNQNNWIGPIMRDGQAVGLIGTAASNPALYTEDRVAKQQQHRDNIKAMQPQYAPMADRQAAVQANAIQRGMGRDARMMGGYGPAIATRMLAQQETAPQGGGAGAIMNPLLAGMMFGPQAFGATMQAGGDMAEIAQRAQLAMQEMQNRREIAQMGGEQDLAQINAKSAADRALLTDPEVLRAKQIAGGMSADQADLAMGKPEAVLKSLAMSAGSFDEFFNKAKAQFPTMQEDALAAIYQGATGTDPYAPGFWSTRPRPAAGAAPQTAATPKVQSLLPNVSIDTGYVPRPQDKISGAMSRGWSQQY